jgi:hypothetical protein
MRISDAEFQAKVSTFLGDSEDNVAKAAEQWLVSIPTVRRWKEGKNLPAKNVRAVIVRMIEATQ